MCILFIKYTYSTALQPFCRALATFINYTSSLKVPYGDSVHVRELVQVELLVKGLLISFMLMLLSQITSVSIGPLFQDLIKKMFDKFTLLFSVIT